MNGQREAGAIELSGDLLEQIELVAGEVELQEWVARAVGEKIRAHLRPRPAPLPPEEWSEITKIVMSVHFDFTEPHGPKDGRPGVRSSLVSAIKDARGAVKRDVDSGLYRNDADADAEHCANWLGAVGYLMALDQVGSCFAIVGQADQRRVPIIRALGAFAPHITATEAHALYALRCSVAHTYGLMNKGREDRRQAHIFRLAPQGDQLVKLPPKSRRWNGDLGTLPQLDAAVDWTLVSTWHVAELVEDIVTTVLPDHLAAGTLAIDGEMSEPEFVLGYQIGVIGPGSDHP